MGFSVWLKTQSRHSLPFFCSFSPVVYVLSTYHYILKASSYIEQQAASKACSGHTLLITQAIDRSRGWENMHFSTMPFIH